MLKTYSYYDILSIFCDNIFVFAIFFVQIYNYQVNTLYKLHNKLQNIKSNKPQTRLSLVKRAVSDSWLRDWKIFCLYTMFGCKFGCKSDYCIKVNLSGFLTKNHLPLHVMPRGYKGGCVGDFWGCYLQSKFDVNRLFMCKPVVCIGVQWTPLRIYFINMFICNRNLA